MTLKIECHSQYNASQNGMSLKMEYHLKQNITQNGIPQQK